MSKPLDVVVEDLESVRGGRTLEDGAPEEILTVQDLDVVYEVARPVHAVRGATLTLHRGEVLGVP